MTVLVTVCFIQVVGGYINVAQITSISKEVVCTSQNSGFVLGALEHCTKTGDSSAEDFVERIKHTCGGRK